MVKITLIIHPKGVARTLRRLVDYLEQEDISYQIFAPETNQSVPELPHVHRFASLPFFLYPECRLALPNPLDIHQKLKQFNPTLLHIATPFNLGLLGLQYVKKHGVPMVASYHTHFDDYLSYYHLAFLEKWVWNYMRWFHRSFQKVYVPSPSTKEKLQEHMIHHQIEIWGRGVDHDLYSPNKFNPAVREKYGITEKYMLLYVGRLSPEKEIDVLLHVYHALPEALQHETHLLIVGDGPLFKSLSANSHPRITFTGFIEGEELASLYASSDLFLFPSSTETFGNVVLEALASGFPVVGARAGGVQHLVQHGRTGFLSTPQDLSALVQAVITILSNAELRTSMSEAARNFAVIQSWDAIFSQLINNYMEVAEASKTYSA